MSQPQGVALILTKIQTGEIFVIQEKEDKPLFGKKAGDFSIPMEGKKNDETDLDVIARLGREEIGSDVVFETPIYLGEYDILGNAKLNAYMAVFVRDFGFHPTTPQEVKKVGWMQPIDFLQLQLRYGALEIVFDYMQVVTKKIRAAGAG